MLTVFVADIFGLTPALKQLSMQVAPNNHLIIDPYNHQAIDFEDEKSAYTYFSEQVGLQHYMEHIQQTLETLQQPFNIVAFSVGGSAVWLNAEWLTTTKVNRIVCFYASQIRHYLAQPITMPITLILPKSEPHFDINAFKHSIALNDNIIIKHSEYLHGFMNKQSANFSDSAYLQYTQWLVESSQ